MSLVAESHSVGWFSNGTFYAWNWHDQHLLLVVCAFSSSTKELQCLNYWNISLYFLNSVHTISLYIDWFLFYFVSPFTVAFFFFSLIAYLFIFVWIFVGSYCQDWSQVDVISNFSALHNTKHEKPRN